MRQNKSLLLQIENLLLEARQAGDPTTNGLLDRTDCLELISRLAAAIQKILGTAQMRSSKYKIKTIVNLNVLDDELISIDAEDLRYCLRD